MLTIVFIVLIIVCIVQFNKNDDLTRKIKKLEEENEILRKKLNFNSKDTIDVSITKISSENNVEKNMLKRKVFLSFFVK